jgi:hypothetical protein
VASDHIVKFDEKHNFNEINEINIKITQTFLEFARTVTNLRF